MKPANLEELASLIGGSKDRLHEQASVILKDPAVKAAVQRDQNPDHAREEARRRLFA